MPRSRMLGGLAALALAGCMTDPVSRVTVRNDTDRALAFEVHAIPELATLGAPLNPIHPYDPTFAATGITVLDPGAESTVDAPQPGAGVALVVWVDRQVPDGAFVLSDVVQFPDDVLHGSDGLARLVSYRDPG